MAWGAIDWQMIESIFSFHVAGFTRIRIVVARILANSATNLWVGGL